MLSTPDDDHIGLVRALFHTVGTGLLLVSFVVSQFLVVITAVEAVGNRRPALPEWDLKPGEVVYDHELHG